MPSSGYTAITFVANEQPTTAKWNLIGSNDSSFNLGTGLEDATILARHLAVAAVGRTKIDWSTFSLNMKSALNTSAPSLFNGDNNFASVGGQVTFTVSAACKAFVSVTVGIFATGGDFENRPSIFVDGVLISQATPSAATGSGSGRTFVRSYAGVVSLSAGAHTISVGTTIASGSGLNSTAGSHSVAAIVLGDVTA